ncbi:hypothetical protein SFRURICE_001985 [Spodoptera frugiperda]|nr:hypothetical protein SFRURICE_001985 [Spodoptera frugiperda]
MERCVLWIAFLLSIHCTLELPIATWLSITSSQHSYMACLWWNSLIIRETLPDRGFGLDSRVGQSRAGLFSSVFRKFLSNNTESGIVLSIWQ